MRITLNLIIPAIIALALFTAASVGTATAQDISIITKEELNNMLTDQNVIVMDARSGRDWSASEFKIQGATRTDPYDIGAWVDTFSKDKKVVLYCA